MKHKASKRRDEENQTGDGLDEAELARLRETNKRLERLVGVIDGLDPAEAEPSGHPGEAKPSPAAPAPPTKSP